MHSESRFTELGLPNADPGRLATVGWRGPSCCRHPSDHYCRTAAGANINLAAQGHQLLDLVVGADKPHRRPFGGSTVTLIHSNRTRSAGWMHLVIRAAIRVVVGARPCPLHCRPGFQVPPSSPVQVLARNGGARNGLSTERVLQGLLNQKRSLYTSEPGM
jgi:hypothetical protein